MYYDKSKYDIEPSINGEPAKLHKRRLSSPSIQDGILDFGDIAVRLPENTDVNGEIVLTLRLTLAR